MIGSFYSFYSLSHCGSCCSRRGLARPTISAQIRALEDHLGMPLFLRERRRLALTEAGRIVFQYASEIFSLGDELLSAVRGGVSGKLTVGVLSPQPSTVSMILTNRTGPVQGGLQN